VVTVIHAPLEGGKRRHLIRDMLLFGMFASAVAVPVSPWVSSLFYKEQRGTWFEFKINQTLSAAVKLNNIRMEPRGAGQVNVTLNYTQLLRDETLGKTSLCFHVVPEEPANVEDRHRERGYNHFDFTPDPPLGSWYSTYYQERLLSFADLTNQRATIRLATWSPVTKIGTAMYSYPFDFAEFEQGWSGAYAGQIASPRKRNLAIYFATVLGLLILIIVFSRSRKNR